MAIVYTYDRIVLGVLYLLISVFVIYRIVRRIFEKHRYFSVDNYIHHFCLLWTILRSLYFFLPDLPNPTASGQCGIECLFIIPVVAQFSVFSLMMLYFAQTFSTKEEWNRPFRIVPMCCKRCVKSYFPCLVSLFRGGLLRRRPRMSPQQNIRQQTFLMRNSTSVSTTELEDDDDLLEQDYFFKDPGSVHENGITRWSWSTSFLNERSSEGNSKERKFCRVRKGTFLILHFIVFNILWFLFVVFRLGFLCYEFWSPAGLGMTNQGMYQAFGVIMAVVFFVLMVALTLYAVRLSIKIKNDEIPMELKLSSISIPSILLVIALCTSCFAVRSILDIFLVFWSRINEFFAIDHLRETDFGRPILIFQFTVFEIIPIISVLYFFSRIMTLQKTKRFHRELRENQNLSTRKNKSSPDLPSAKVNDDIEKLNKSEYAEVKEEGGEGDRDSSFLRSPSESIPISGSSNDDLSNIPRNSLGSSENSSQVFGKYSNFGSMKRYQHIFDHRGGNNEEEEGFSYLASATPNYMVGAELIEESDGDESGGDGNGED